MSARSVSKRQYAVKHATDAPAPVRTPAGDTVTALVFRALELARRFTDAGEALARPAGQTLARWVVLDQVDAEPATVATIAHRLGLARQSVQRLADLLAADGLATYQENPRHRSAKLLSITAAGRGTLREIQERQRAWADAVGADIGERELDEAMRHVDGVLAALERRRPR